MTTTTTTATAVRRYHYGPSALLTLPNLVTFTRLAVTPLLLWSMVEGRRTWGVFAFWLALHVSDFLDGWLARRLGETRSGAFLDPLADKVFLISTMVALVVAGRFWWLPVAAIAAREVAMSVYRTWISRRGVSVPATGLAKAKTNVQGIAVGVCLAPLTAHAELLGDTLLWAAVILTLVTGLQYGLQGRKLLRAG